MKWIFLFMSLIFSFKILEAADMPYIGGEISRGNLTIDNVDKDIYDFEVFMGVLEEEKVSTEIYFKHISSEKVADFLGVNLRKGFDIFSTKSWKSHIIPFVKIGVGLSLIDIFLEKDDSDPYEKELELREREKQKKLSLNGGMGLNFYSSKSFDVYTAYDSFFLFPLKDNIQEVSLGVMYKF